MSVKLPFLVFFFLSPAATLLAGPRSQKGSVAQVGPRGGGVASRCRGCGSCLFLPASPELPFSSIKKPTLNKKISKTIQLQRMVPKASSKSGSEESSRLSAPSYAQESSLDKSEDLSSGNHSGFQSLYSKLEAEPFQEFQFAPALNLSSNFVQVLSYIIHKIDKFYLKFLQILLHN